MQYPEPSRNDHNAPWNMKSVEDEDGEEYDTCGCHYCEKARRDNDDDRGDWEYELWRDRD